MRAEYPNEPLTRNKILGAKWEPYRPRSLTALRPSRRRALSANLCKLLGGQVRRSRLPALLAAFAAERYRSRVLTLRHRASMPKRSEIVKKNSLDLYLSAKAYLGHGKQEPRAAENDSGSGIAPEQPRPSGRVW